MSPLSFAPFSFLPCTLRSGVNKSSGSILVEELLVSTRFAGAGVKPSSECIFVETTVGAATLSGGSTTLEKGSLIGAVVL